MVPVLGTIASSFDNTVAARGLFAGGTTLTNVIDYINIATTGNATDFGDLITARTYGTGFGSATRSFFAHGYNAASTYYNSIEYVTTATTGNATSFGNATITTAFRGSCASATRGVMSGGYNNGTVNNVIDYVTMASEGNAIDFGDMLAEVYSVGGCSSPTRGLFGGLARYGAGNLARIEYITIATTGNSTNFGDKTTVSAAHWSGVSSSTRGMWLGGYSTASATHTNVIDYVTIASTGNATDFGDLINDNQGGSVSSSIRGVTANGYVGDAIVNSMEYITIATTGNGTDFGDLTVSRYAISCASNAHGGL